MPVRRLPFATVAAGLLLAAAPAVAAAGPPWISIELPANPLDGTTRGAYLLVRTYHHANVLSAPLTGQAIGMVNGERRTVRLEFERTGTPGVYALRRTWPAEGAWALAIHLGEGTSGGATALVGVAADGEVRSVRVPTHRDGDRTWPRPASSADIERTLGEVAALPAAAPERGRSAAAWPLALAALLPIGFGVRALRRR